MPISRCPHCKQRFVHDDHAVDFVHDCDSGNPALDQEDKFDITSHPLAGSANKLAGKNAELEGAHLQSTTSRGNNKNTHETRARQIYIDLKTKQWSPNPRR